MASFDLLGREQTRTEEQVLALYQEVKRLLEQEDLAPGMRANLQSCLAHLWQIVVNLNLEFEQLNDYGV